MEEIKAYRTSDGKVFAYKPDAENHEAFLKSRFLFRVDYEPKLDRGYGFNKSKYIVVNNRTDESLATLIAEHFCYNNFGNKVLYRGKGFNPTAAWTLNKLNSAIKLGDEWDRFELE
jgi:hypothetical protein